MAAAAKDDVSESAEPLGIGETAITLATALSQGDLLYAAIDDHHGVALTQALRAAAPDALVLFCPGSDALPGDDSPASPSNVGQRVSALRQIRLALAEADRAPIACITTGEALARLYPAPATFDTVPPRAVTGAAVDVEALSGQLAAIGYVVAEQVDEPGQVARRGQVLDVYPADAPAPLRIEVIDGTIAAIRAFDPTDQRTTEERDRCELGQVAEPLLRGRGVTLLDHLPAAARVAIPAASDDRRRHFLALARDALKRAPKRAPRDIASDAAWRKALGGRVAIPLTTDGAPPPRFVESRRPLKAFATTVEAALGTGERVVLLGGERDLRFLARRIASVLPEPAIHARAWADVAAAKPGTLLTLAMPIDRGCRHDGVLAIAAADLLGSRAERADASAAPVDPSIFAVGEIRIGDVVVHEDHGIGVVAGLDRMPAVEGAATAGDAIALTYADQGVRLVPVAEADRIWRYGAEADAVALDRLDGHSWIKRRGAIDAAIAQSARALTTLAKERATRHAPVLAPDPAAYERFAARFAFTETADQARAIVAVRADLGAGTPMDRLVVGDVGYGKTEVALRAAAIAALAGYQVAVAAPTTVLARQHLDSFTDRFAGTGIVVAGLSRLSSAADKKRVKAGVADGSVHVVIGTAAVAAKGIAYRNLALTVIDEEQRFGAADKARMRALGGAGHVLTMSATPIPRTLQTALMGLQQLSVIATPPARRQPIRTSVGAFVPATVRTALLRERSRGGQSFVVVPRIEDMGPIADELATLVPELQIVRAHGKMPAAEIDDAMVGFARGDGDVLLATNIIEAGLDVPRANTMVIWRADRFGLSQLHQLRGRVGRGERRGQVLLLTEPDTAIAPRTLKRLRTLEAFDRLGAGFAISARDLDMRGAGDLLGEAQAGHMKLIGVDLYQHLLEASLRAARGEDAERWTPELHIGVDGRLPEDWLPDAALRVTLYCRLARLETGAALTTFAAELEDRFGPLPPEADTLLRIAQLRNDSRIARIARIDAGPAAIALTPRRDFAGAAADSGLQEKGDRLLLAERIDDPLDRLARLETLLSALVDREG